MNHHEFREFIKSIPAANLRALNVNPAHFKTVCYTLSMYGDYATGREIRPSWLTVAREAGVNRKTAMKVRDMLLKYEILIQTRKTEGNISVYKFNQLSTFNDQLSVFTEQLSSISGHNTTIDTTIDNNKLKLISIGYQEEEVSLGIKL